MARIATWGVSGKKLCENYNQFVMLPTFGVVIIAALRLDQTGRTFGKVVPPTGAKELEQLR